LSIELVYEEAADGTAGWRSLGWIEDTFREYAAFAEYKDD
jgi:hypothetical protein